MVTGSYYCTLNCIPQAFNLNREGIVELYEQDGELRGVMIGTFFWMPSSFCGGKIDGDNFEFEAPFNTACQQYVLRVKGTVKGDELEAIAESSMGPLTVTGYRVQDSYQNRYGAFPIFQRTLKQLEERK